MLRSWWLALAICAGCGDGGGPPANTTIVAPPDAQGAQPGTPATGTPDVIGDTPTTDVGSDTGDDTTDPGAGSGSLDAPDAGDGHDITPGVMIDAGGAPVIDAGAPSAGDDRCDLGTDDGTTPTPLPLSGNTFAHDPTMIEADGVFYRFWTGDDIPMARSMDLMRWDDGAPVYEDGLPSWSSQWLASVPGQTFNFPWAPDVSYFGGRYHIYSSFSARFGDNVSCITHLTTDDIASGDWTDHGPVICTEGDEPYNAIDADVGIAEDGTPWLAFGSFWNGIMAFELDQDGNRVGDALARLAWAPEIEAPVLLRRCGYYYLFVTWGLCCPGAGRRVDQLTYRVVVGRSENIMGPYVDRTGKPLLEEGGTPVVSGDGVQFAAAGHSDVLVTGERMYHVYHAYRLPTGNAQLRIVELRFDAEGWPLPAGP